MGSSLVSLYIKVNDQDHGTGKKKKTLRLRLSTKLNDQWKEWHKNIFQHTK